MPLTTAIERLSPDARARLAAAFQAIGSQEDMLRRLSEQPSFVMELDIKPRKPMKERELSTEEFLNLFEKKESLVMAYIPHFITQCVVYYLDMLTDYTRRYKLVQYKKHCRQLLEVKQEYIHALRHEMPPQVFEKFLTQRDEFLWSCGSNLQLMYFTFGNELKKRYGYIAHEEVLCYAHIIIAFIDYVEEFDRKVNKRIAERMKMPCRNQGDARLTAIKAVCLEMVDAYPIEKNEQTEICVTVMANKAIAMINAMLNKAN